MNEILRWVAAILAAIVPESGPRPSPCSPAMSRPTTSMSAAPSPGHDRRCLRSSRGCGAARATSCSCSASAAAGASSLQPRRGSPRRRRRSKISPPAAASEEVDVIRASLGRPKPIWQLARPVRSQSQPDLFAKGLFRRAKLDASTSARARNQRRGPGAQLKAQLAVAELPAREAQQLAAEANRPAAQADAEQGAGRSRRPHRQRAGRRAHRAPLLRSPAKWRAAGTPVLSLLPAGALKVKFYVPEADRPRLRPRRQRGGQLRRLRRRADRHGELSRQRAAVHPAGHLFARGARAGWSFWPRPRLDSPAQSAARPAGDAWGCAMTPTTPPVIDVSGLTKNFGDKPVVDHFDINVPQGRDLRLSRAQRLGQDHDHPHAVRPADARWRRGHLPRLRHAQTGAADQGTGRLHDAEVLALRGPVDPREPRFRRPHVPARRAASSGSTQALERSRPRRPAEATGRHAVGRLEAAAGACRLPAARPATAAARRADRRRRPQGAARFLGRNPPAVGARASPCWSRPTTWTRRCSATSSPISPMARS